MNILAAIELQKNPIVECGDPGKPLSVSVNAETELRIALLRAHHRLGNTPQTPSRLIRDGFEICVSGGMIPGVIAALEVSSPIIVQWDQHGMTWMNGANGLTSDAMLYQMITVIDAASRIHAAVTV